MCDDEDLKPIENEGESKSLTVRVTSAGQSWLLRRTYDNFRMLDQQLHRCIYDRKFSNLTELSDTPDESQVSDIPPPASLHIECNVLFNRYQATNTEQIVIMLVV